MANPIDKVLDIVEDTSDFLGVSGGGGLSGLQDAFLGEAFLKELFKVLGEGAPVFTSALGEGIAGVTPELAKALKEVVSTILDVLTKSLKQIKNFPAPFVEGPLNAFEALQEIGKLNKLIFVDHDRDTGDPLSALERLRDRIDVVNNSLVELFTLMTGTEELGADVLFRNLLNTFNKSVLKILDPKPGETIEDVLAESIKDIVFPVEVIEAVFQSAAEQKFWAFVALPRGLLGGQLNDWLNDANNFLPKDTARPWKRSLEREYRCRLIRALDAYVRQRLGPFTSGASAVADPISAADKRMSFETLSDILCILLETTILFALEPDCFPRLDVDLDSFDDIGIHLGSIAAKQLKIPIRGLVGLILRGISFWSINNDALIEFLGSLISTVLSAFLEAAFRNLAWTLQIVGCNPSFDSSSTSGVLHRWSSLETIENTNEDTDQLAYVVLLRNPLTNGSVHPLVNLNDFPLLKRLVQDIGAYVDVAYQEFKIGSVFVPGLATDEVRVVRAEWNAGRIMIEATTTGSEEIPPPILRAYFCCHTMAMRPSEAAGHYTIDVECDNLPRRPTVTLLSNRGGTATRKIDVVR